MFALLSRHFQDARTLTQLCTTAEDLARVQGRAKPAFDNFVLAALDLPDGTAHEAFKRLSLTKSGFIAAIEAQRATALAAVGVTVTQSTPAASRQDFSPPKSRFYEAAPSGQSLVQRLAESRQARRRRRLLSADVLLAVAQEVNSTASRAFDELGISGTQLTNAASSAIVASSALASDAQPR